MIDGLDHIAIAAADVASAAGAYATLLGRPPDRGGAFQLDNMALELVAADEPVGAKAPPWTLAFAAGDLPETRRRLERRGLPSAPPRSGLSLIDVAATHGVAVALIERAAAAAPHASFADDAVHGLDHVVIRTTHPDRALGLYGARLGLDLRLDRSNPQWNSRLMFFACGDAVLEVAVDLAADTLDEPDRVTGLAWRVADPAAARARLAATGLDVSSVRPGRKPGTQIFTVRSGVVGAPALMIGGEGAR
jgi:catechol 2,3-dioxygenase-like lactoylglutathione lyase family enzyme